MKMLSVQKVSREDLLHHWKIEGRFIPYGELFIRSDKKGKINWDKAPVYTWSEIEKEQKRRRVIFTTDPIEYLLPHEIPKP